jgi:hypothetical protein
MTEPTSHHDAETPRGRKPGCRTPDRSASAPPGFDREISEAALAAGCDVIVEKPFTDELSDAVAIVLTARAAERTVAVMQNRRYHPAVRRVRAGLAAGEIGDRVDTAVDIFVWHIHSDPYMLANDSHGDISSSPTAPSSPTADRGSPKEPRRPTTAPGVSEERAGRSAGTARIGSSSRPWSASTDRMPPAIQRSRKTSHDSIASAIRAG